MRQAIVQCLIVLAIAFKTHCAQAEVLQVHIYPDGFAQLSVVAGKRVVAQTKWIYPPKDKEEGEPRIVNLPCNQFPCTIRVRWANNTYESFGPIRLDSGFDDERKLVVAIKPVWEAGSEEYTYRQWDRRQRRWLLRIGTRDKKTESYVFVLMECEGYELPREQSDEESR